MQHPLVSRTVLAAVMMLVAPLPAGAVPAPVAAPAAPPPAPDAGAFLAGMVAGRSGDDAAASALLFDALRRDPDAEAVRTPAFLFATLAGDPRAAGLAADPGTGLIGALVLANRAAMAGDWPAAARLYGALPGSALTGTVRPLLQAWALQGEGRTDEALRLLGGVPSGSPLAAVAALQAGSIAELAGRTTQASSLFGTAQAVFPSTGLGTVQVVGGFLASTGRGAAADAMLQELARRLPVIGLVEPGLSASLRRPLIRTPAQGLARAFMAIAVAMLEGGSGDPDANGGQGGGGQGGGGQGGGGQGGEGQGGEGQGGGAREAARFMLRFALDLDPGLTAARLSLVELVAPNHPDQGLAVLDGVAVDDPLAPLVLLRRATLLAAAGRTDDSLRILRALAGSMPARPEPWQTLGDVLSDARRFAEAVPAYDRAIRDREALNGGHLAGTDWQLLFSRAVAFDRTDRWPDARADLDRALALSPSEPFVLNYLGYSMVERNLDLAAARTLISRALDAEPDDGSIRDSLGWVMLRQGDVPDAVHTLERAAEQDPEDPTVNFHLGAAYWAAGRCAEAEDQWRWALVLGPEQADAVKIRDALRRAAAPQGSSGVAPSGVAPAGVVPR